VKKTAVMLDLGFVLNKLRRLLGNRPSTANEIHGFAHKCLQAPEEELFRIYCYHCWPYAGVEKHPLTQETQDFSQTPQNSAMTNLLRNLSLKDNVALRPGELSFDGWKIKKWSVDSIARTGRALEEQDFVPDLKQKRVDMKIGLDVAWLSSKSIVERIVLVTSDSDFVPAMKFARREGIQIILFHMDHKQVKRDLLVHADEVRSVKYP
jgi:uncharacterized LabA/DUF88 family protein